MMEAHRACRRTEGGNEPTGRIVCLGKSLFAATAAVPRHPRTNVGVQCKPLQATALALLRVEPVASRAASLPARTVRGVARLTQKATQSKAPWAAVEARTWQTHWRPGRCLPKSANHRASPRWDARVQHRASAEHPKQRILPVTLSRITDISAALVVLHEWRQSLPMDAVVQIARLASYAQTGSQQMEGVSWRVANQATAQARVHAAAAAPQNGRHRWCERGR
jgi:hypothetical protein